MKRFKSTKWIATGAVAILFLGGGVAFAIITLTGSGTGNGPAPTGTGGSATVTLSVHVASSPTLVPGATVPVDFDATNANASPVTISTISLVSVTDPSNSLCNSLLSNYPQFTLAPLTVNEAVPAGKTMNLIPSGALTWVSLPNTPQDACLGQTLTVSVKTP